MDCLPLGKHVLCVTIILCALQLVKCVPINRYSGTGRYVPAVPRYTSAPVYQRYVPFRRQLYNSWNGAPFYFTRPSTGHLQNRLVGNNLQNNFRSRVQNGQIMAPSSFPSRWRSFRTYNSPTQRPHFVPMITRPPRQPPKKISVVSGPLNRVFPHPKPRNMKAKKRLRYRLVAKAKSFPGILKDTSLDVTKVRKQQL